MRLLPTKVRSCLPFFACASGEQQLTSSQTLLARSPQEDQVQRGGQLCQLHQDRSTGTMTTPFVLEILRQATDRPPFRSSVHLRAGLGGAEPSDEAAQGTPQSAQDPVPPGTRRLSRSDSADPRSGARQDYQHALHPFQTRSSCAHFRLDSRDPSSTRSFFHLSCTDTTRLTCFLLSTVRVLQRTFHFYRRHRTFVDPTFPLGFDQHSHARSLYGQLRSMLACRAADLRPGLRASFDSRLLHDSSSKSLSFAVAVPAVDHGQLHSGTSSWLHELLSSNAVLAHRQS